MIYESIFLLQFLASCGQKLCLRFKNNENAERLIINNQKHLNNTNKIYKIQNTKYKKQLLSCKYREYRTRAIK